MVELAEILYQHESVEKPVLLSDLPAAFFHYFEVECK